MSTIKFKQFKNDFKNGIDIDNLSEEAKDALEDVGLSQAVLNKIDENKDGKITGGERKLLFDELDRFDNNKLDGKFKTRDINGVATLTGEAYDALKSEFESNRKKALQPNLKDIGKKISEGFTHGGQEISKFMKELRTDQIKTLLENPNTPQDIKRSQMLLLNKEEFQTIFSRSGKWPEDTQKVLTEVMAGSEALMEKAGKELDVDSQVKLAKNIRNLLVDTNALTLKQRGDAIRKLMENTSKEGLNELMAMDNMPMAYLFVSSEKLHDRVGDLNLKNQEKIYIELLKSPYEPRSLSESQANHVMSIIRPKMDPVAVENASRKWSKSHN